MPSTAEESIPELLARLDREHPKRDSQLAKHPRFAHFCGKCLTDWPCETARVVAHIRSLEAAIRKLEAAKETNEGIEFGFKYVPVEDAYYDLLDILGEAQ